MRDIGTAIHPYKRARPFLYSWRTDDVPKYAGWEKIGYTEMQTPDERIAQQTGTMRIHQQKLWEKPATFTDGAGGTFTDKEFHRYLTQMGVASEADQFPQSEWYHISTAPVPDSLHYLRLFRDRDFTELQVAGDETYRLRPEQEAAVQLALRCFSNDDGATTSPTAPPGAAANLSPGDAASPQLEPSNLDIGVGAALAAARKSAPEARGKLTVGVETPTSEVLWNAKPRFGKTLATYDLMRRMGARRVLIVTNRPAIANSWFDDFQRFIAHQTTYKFVSESASLADRPVLTREQWRKMPKAADTKLVEFVSLQDLKGSRYFGGAHDKLKHIADFDWDLLVIDEAHEGIDTNKTDVAFDKIKRCHTLHLSGTPFKALASGKFPESHIFNWTYEDEQQAKANWDARLVAAAEAGRLSLSKPSSAAEPPELAQDNPYAALPTLNLLTYRLGPMVTAHLSPVVEAAPSAPGLETTASEPADLDFAFDLNEFFATKDNGYFTHEAEVIKWLDALTTNHKYPFSTPELRDEIRHSFWLLHRVASAKALQKLLKKHPAFAEFEIILAAGNATGREKGAPAARLPLRRTAPLSGGDKPLPYESNVETNSGVGAALAAARRSAERGGILTQSVSAELAEADDDAANAQSLARVRAAIDRAEANGTKTITLSVGQLTTGVTVPEWTSVMMLSNLKSPALYMQAAFRAQNPYQYERDGQVFRKQNAYIFDFAPERTLTIFDEFANNLNPNPNHDWATRQQNIRTLLNFFPVLGEDEQGEMVQLDAEQVLTFPRIFKAQEVVRRGFMSNLLFDNVAGIFRYSEHLKEVLTKLPQADAATGRLTTSGRLSLSKPPDDVEIDAQGNVHLPEQVINQQAAKFAAPVFHYEAIPDKLAGTPLAEVIKTTQKAVREAAAPTRAELAETYNQTKKQVERDEKRTDQAIRAGIERADTEHKIATAHLAHEREAAATEAEHEAVEAKQHQIDAVYQSEVHRVVALQMETLLHGTVKREETKREQKRADTAMDEVRAHLRGFARTIPMFLMAYGDRNLTLANFDHYTDATVFREITGITIEEFKTLRDGVVSSPVVEPVETTTQDDAGRPLPVVEAAPSAPGLETTTSPVVEPVETTIHVIPARGAQRHDPESLHPPALGLFDEVVFNQAVQEFFNKRDELADYFDDSLTEDIFAYIPRQKTSLVFTPEPVVVMMVDILERENPGIFSSTTTTFADLFSKAGLFLMEIVKRLDHGLAEQMPDREQRLRHIFTNQIFGLCPGEIYRRLTIEAVSGGNPERKRWLEESGHIQVGDLVKMTKAQRETYLNSQLSGVVSSPDAYGIASTTQTSPVVSSPDAYGIASTTQGNPVVDPGAKQKRVVEADAKQNSVVEAAPTAPGLETTTRKFDVIIGNPPYNEDSIGSSTQSPPIYNEFMDAAFPLADIVVLITPGRFLSNAGATPKAWNRKMLTDEHLMVAHFEADGQSLFPGTDLDSVVVTYRDAKQELGPIGEFINSVELRSALSKVLSPAFTPLASIVDGTGQYKYQRQIFDEHPDLMGSLSGTGQSYLRTSAFSTLAPLFHDTPPAADAEYVELLGLDGRKRTKKWILRDYIEVAPSFEKHKVIVSAADGAAVKSGKIIGVPEIGPPGLGYTETFLGIGSFDTENEAAALQKYIKTKFARAMLSTLKTTQHNPSPKWRNVPLQDFTPQSDINWSKMVAEIDQQLYRKYGLTEEEIHFIETKVKPME